ncbi:MAG: hypothetical protein IJZ26_02670 [Clostridia bacterium]|nr:hypothetical protein [Clostridia bacterium]
MLSEHDEIMENLKQKKIKERAIEIYNQHTKDRYAFEGVMDEIELAALKLAFSEDFIAEQKGEKVNKKANLKVANAQKRRNVSERKIKDMANVGVKKTEERIRLEPPTIDNKFVDAKTKKSLPVNEQKDKQM